MYRTKSNQIQFKDKIHLRKDLMMVNDHIWWRYNLKIVLRLTLLARARASIRVLTEDCKEKNLSAEGNIYLGQIQ